MNNYSEIKHICNIPISIGELWDKYTILLIKNEMITDETLLQHVNNELIHLEPYIKKFNLEPNIEKELLLCNKELWVIEDSIREKERVKLFDDSFIHLARSVYIKNDERADIKRRINTIFNSELFEVKSYKKY